MVTLPVDLPVEVQSDTDLNRLMDDIEKMLNGLPKETKNAIAAAVKSNTGECVVNVILHGRS